MGQTITVTCYEYEENGATAVAILKQDANTDDIDTSRLTTYSFDNRPQTVLTSLRTADGITAFGLTRDETGAVNPAAYTLAEAISFAAVHCERYNRNGETVEAPTRQQIEALPEPVLLAYRQRTAVVPNLDAIKKPAPAETPATGSESERPNDSGAANDSTAGT